jgi:hypothetical protein
MQSKWFWFKSKRDYSAGGNRISPSSRKLWFWRKAGVSNLVLVFFFELLYYGYDLHFWVYSPIDQHSKGESF